MLALYAHSPSRSRWVLPSHSHRSCTFITVAAFWPKVVLAFRSALPVCWCGSWLPRHATVPPNIALFFLFFLRFLCLFYAFFFFLVFGYIDCSFLWPSLGLGLAFCAVSGPGTAALAVFWLAFCRSAVSCRSTIVQYFCRQLNHMADDACLSTLCDFEILWTFLLNSFVFLRLTC